MAELMTVRLAELVNARVGNLQARFVYAVPVLALGKMGTAISDSDP
jgi:hypothetical protein